MQQRMPKHPFDFMAAHLNNEIRLKYDARAETENLLDGIGFIFLGNQ